LDGTETMTREVGTMMEGGMIGGGMMAAMGVWRSC
jgi:hypothetical protein